LVTKVVKLRVRNVVNWIEEIRVVIKNHNEQTMVECDNDKRIQNICLIKFFLEIIWKK